MPNPVRRPVSWARRAVHATAFLTLLAGAVAGLAAYGQAWVLAVCALAVGLGGATGVIAWRGSRWGTAWLLVTSLSFALAAGELAALWSASRPASATTQRDPNPYAADLEYYRSDSALGYSLNPNKSIRAGLRDSAGVIYDVMYHVDSHGLRVTPASGTSGPAVGFFGCSWSYGEGIEDDETLPNQFARATGGRYRVFNFALHGYGPHQMLRAIETNRYDSLLGPKPAAFVYLAAGWQVPRSAGHSRWDKKGPRYVLSGDSVRYAGSFDSGVRLFTRALKRSALYELLQRRISPIRSADIDLFVRVIQAADRKLKERYGVGLTVLFVHAPGFEKELRRVGWTDDSIAVALRAAGIAVIDGDTPKAPDHSRFLYALRRDGHPTATANAIRAETLVRSLNLSAAGGRSLDIRSLGLGLPTHGAGK